MNEIDKLSVFYTLPMSLDRLPYLQWHTDPGLVRYIDYFVENNTASSEVAAIGQILVARLRQSAPEKSDPNLHRCVTALLANLLLCSRQRRTHSDLLSIFRLAQYHNTTITIDEVYALGLAILCRPERILKNFEPQCEDWLASLRTYLSIKFKGELVDRLRSSLGQDFNRTNLGLLTRSSPTRLRKALTEAGESEVRLAQMLYLHQCLKETVAANQFDTKNPQVVHYEALLARSKQQMDGASHSIPDVDSLRDVLNYMGNTARSYERTLTNPLDRSESIDRPIGRDNTDARFSVGDLDLDRVVDDSSDSRAEQQELKTRIFNCFGDLPDLIFVLVYGLNLTQADVGKELGCNQSTVQRRCYALLSKLGGQLALELSPNPERLTTQQLAEITSYIEDLAKDYYEELLINIVKNIGSCCADNDDIVARFIEILQSKWQFNFVPEGAGVAKAREFTLWVLSATRRNKALTV